MAVARSRRGAFSERIEQMEPFIEIITALYMIVEAIMWTNAILAVYVVLRLVMWLRDR